jgi:hypothetical protein
MGGGRADQMKLVKALRKQGFTVERTGSGHWKVTREGSKEFAFMAFSPNRVPQHNTIRRLKEMGYRP